MSENFIAYGVLIYFVGLFLSAVTVFVKNFFKKATILFIASNFIGAIVGISYFISFAPREIMLANFTWMFNFSPSISLLGAIFFSIISIISALVGIYSLRYLQLYKKTYNIISVAFLTSLFVFGMQGVLFSNNSFSFLFFWELMSITSFFLVLADRSKESMRAAFLYFIMTHLGASALLAGFLILGNGSLLFDLSSVSMATASLSPVLLSLSFLLFFFGFGSKAGLVPFHVWLPEAHPQAPSHVSAMMSGLMLKIAVFGFIKIVFSFSNLPGWAGLVVIALGIISGLVGALYAVIEKDLKRAFACSSIENMGIIFTMLGLSLYFFSKGESVIALASSVLVFAIIHAVSHAFFKSALFLSSGVIISRVHSRSLEVMGGIAKLMPIFSVAFLLSILSSMPIPPFSTFYGEWGLIQTIIDLFKTVALDRNALIVLVVILSATGLTGGLAIFAMVKMFGISALGLSRAKHIDESDEKNDYMLTFPILILSLATVIIGIFAKTIISLLSANLSFISEKNISSVSFSSTLSSALVFILFIVFVLIAYSIRYFFSNRKLEREYHTWDCGQPIDATMEYTASAFSAPIRFFFLNLLGRKKVLESVAVVESNPWIRKYTFSLSIKSLWIENMYRPAALLLNALAERVKIIQGGRIQYYILFLLATLIVTLFIAL